MRDLISRQAAIDALEKHEKTNGHNYTLFVDIVSECAEIIRDLPPAQPASYRQVTGKLDCIYRQDAIDAMANTLWHYPNECYRNLNEYEFAKGLAELELKSVPSVQSAEAIPVAFLEEQAKWFESMDNAFAKIEANNIRVMIKRWRSKKDERSD